MAWTLPIPMYRTSSPTPLITFFEIVFLMWWNDFRYSSPVFDAFSCMNDLLRNLDSKALNFQADSDLVQSRLDGLDMDKR